jgi:hypothetical protein
VVGKETRDTRPGSAYRTSKGLQNQGEGYPVTQRDQQGAKDHIGDDTAADECHPFVDMELPLPACPSQIRQ